VIPGGFEAVRRSLAKAQGSPEIIGISSAWHKRLARLAQRWPQPPDHMPGLSRGVRPAISRREANAEMIRHPIESNFYVNVSEAAVEVIFAPTRSRYTYSRLVQADLGLLSPDPQVHTGRSADTGGYAPEEVQAMAYRVALATVRRLRRIVVIAAATCSGPPGPCRWLIVRTTLSAGRLNTQPPDPAQDALFLEFLRWKERQKSVVSAFRAHASPVRTQ
jgi:hypothetical protein